MSELLQPRPAASRIVPKVSLVLLQNNRDLGSITLFSSENASPSMQHVAEASSDFRSNAETLMYSDLPLNGLLLSSHASKLTAYCFLMQLAFKQAQVLHPITNIDTFTQQEVGFNFGTSNESAMTSATQSNTCMQTQPHCGWPAPVVLGGMCCGCSRRAVGLL